MTHALAPRVVAAVPAGILLLAAVAFAGGPADSSFGAERRWLAENPQALESLGEMSREDLGRFLSTYQNLSTEEKTKLRDHAGELQALSPKERKWALDHPGAVRKLGDLPADERGAILETYRGLSPETQRTLRDTVDGD